MALEYVEPIMTCDGVEETVEHVWAKYNNTTGVVREHYFNELTLHQLFYPCPKLRLELQRAALQNGYKRYVNNPDESGNWGGKQPLNYMLVAEVEYMKTDFRTSLLEKKVAALDRRLLHKWINDYFRPKNRKKYEWYAFWLLLNDKGLIRENDLTLFSKQMVTWFPAVFLEDVETASKSLAKAIRIYNRILGDSPMDWNDDDILTIIHDPARGIGASEQGYEKIKNIFFNLRTVLQPRNLINAETERNMA